MKLGGTVPCSTAHKPWQGSELPPLQLSAHQSLFEQWVGIEPPTLRPLDDHTHHWATSVCSLKKQKCVWHQDTLSWSLIFWIASSNLQLNVCWRLISTRWWVWSDGWGGCRPDASKDRVRMSVRRSGYCSIFVPTLTCGHRSGFWPKEWGGGPAFPPGAVSSVSQLQMS